MQLKEQNEKVLEALLLDYVERYGLTPAARKYFVVHQRPNGRNTATDLQTHMDEAH